MTTPSPNAQSIDYDGTIESASERDLEAGNAAVDCVRRSPPLTTGRHINIWA
jgi:hypothetical protein